jgi:hypothetical protein
MQAKLQIIRNLTKPTTCISVILSEVSTVVPFMLQLHLYLKQCTTMYVLLNELSFGRSLLRCNLDNTRPKLFLVVWIGFEECNSNCSTSYASKSTNHTHPAKTNASHMCNFERSFISITMHLFFASSEFFRSSVMLDVRLALQTKEQIVNESVETNVEVMCIIKCIYFCTTVEVTLQISSQILHCRIQHSISSMRLTAVTPTNFTVSSLHF